MADSSLDPVPLIQILAKHRVAYVVIGGLAAVAHGSPSVTQDLDICYQRTRSNMAAMAEALRELRAELAGADPGLPFQLDGRTFEMGDSFTFDTDAGRFDCLATPSGTGGYDDLIKNADVMDVFGYKVNFASLDDLIRMKRAAGRPKDRVEVEILGALRQEIDAQQRRA